MFCKQGIKGLKALIPSLNFLKINCLQKYPTPPLPDFSVTAVFEIIAHQPKYLAENPKHQRWNVTSGPQQGQRPEGDPRMWFSKMPPILTIGTNTHRFQRGVEIHQNQPKLLLQHVTLTAPNQRNSQQAFIGQL